MTRTKAISLLLVAILILAAASAVLTPTTHLLVSAFDPNQGNSVAPLIDNTPGNLPALACDGCSGGGSGGV